MISLRQIAQEVIRLESGGDVSNESPYDEGYTIRLARQAANTLLAPMIFGNLAEDDRGTLELLIVRYTVDVQEDEDGNQYMTLPEFFMRLPFNRGLRGIAPVEDPSNEFIPRHQPGVSRGLPCADVEQQYSYYQEGFTIYFDQELEFGKVLLKLLVAAPDSILPDAPLPLYPEMQLPIIQMVRQLYQNRPLMDKILDQNPDSMRTPG